MAKFILAIEGQQPITGEISLNTTPQYYRVLHDVELRSGIRACASCPEVFNLGSPNDNNSSYRFFLNEKWQRFSFDLFCKSGYNRYSYQLTKAEYDFMAAKWTALYLGWIAFTNGQGTDTRHNYILNTHVDKPDVAYDKIRVCGGATITGEEELNSAGIPVLRVDTFNGWFDPPPVEAINLKTETRLFYATIVNKTGLISRFPQLVGLGSPTPLTGHDVPVPIICDEPVYYPLSQLKKLPLGSPIPSPYKIGA